MNSNTQNKKIEAITETTLVVGIDVGSETHYAKAFDFRDIEYSKKPFKFSNDEMGFASFKAWILNLKEAHEKDKVIPGMEPTGHYWFNLGNFLQDNEMKPVLVNTHHVKKSKELDDNNPTKNDRKDPKVITGLVREGRYMIPYLPDGVYADLRTASNIRFQVQSELTRIQNRISRWFNKYFPEYKTVYGKVDAVSGMMILKKALLPEDILTLGVDGANQIWRDAKLRAVGKARAKTLVEAAEHSVGNKEGATTARLELRMLLDDYETRNARLQEVMTLIEELVIQIPMAEKMLEIKGVGIKTVSGFLAEVGDISRFNNPKELQHQSNQSIKEDAVLMAIAAKLIRVFYAMLMSIIPEDLRWRNWAVDDGKGTALTGDKLLDFVNNKLFPGLKGLDVNASTPIKKAIVKTTFEDANQYMKDGVLLRQIVNVIDSLDLGDYEESHAFGDIYESILKELQSAGSSGEFYTPRAVTDFMAEMIKPQIGENMADFACGTGGFLVSWLKRLEQQVDTTEDQEAMGSSIYGIEKKQFPYMLCVTNMLLHGVDVPKVYHDNSLLRDVLDYTEKDQFDVILMNPPYGGSEKNDVKNHFPADLASSETADLFMSVIMYRLKRDGRAAVILPDGFLFGTDNTKVAIKKKLMSEYNLHTIVRMPSSVFSPYTSITTNILFFDRSGATKETWFYRLDMPEGYKHFSKTKPMKSEHFDPVRDWWENRTEIRDTETDTFKSKCYTAQEIADGSYNLDLCGYPHEEEEILPPKELIQQYQEKRASLNADIDRILDKITDILGISVEDGD